MIFLKAGCSWAGTAPSMAASFDSVLSFCMHPHTPVNAIAFVSCHLPQLLHHWHHYIYAHVVCRVNHLHQETDC